MRYIVILLITFLALPTVAQVAPRTLTVTGEGRVVRAPDMATISLAVVSRASTPTATLRDNSSRTAAVIARLTAEGLARREIQTSTLSLSPVWTRAADTGKRARIAGYSATNRLTIRVRDLGHLGKVLDAVVTQGANQFGGLSFGLQKPQPALDKARIAAVHEALRKAALYARAAGLSLGPVLTMTEAGSSAPQPVMFLARARSTAVPIAAGELVLSARVTVTLALGN